MVLGKRVKNYQGNIITDLWILINKRATYKVLITLMLDEVYLLRSLEESIIDYWK